MSRAYNFSAGPAVLPLEVLQDAQKDLVDYKGCGMSVMEMSHRGKDYDAIHQEAIATFKELCGLNDDWSVCFIQGGASMQFAMIPMNFLGKDQSADYANQGTWSNKALKQALREVNKLDMIKASLIVRNPRHQSLNIDKILDGDLPTDVAVGDFVFIENYCELVKSAYSNLNMGNSMNAGLLKAAYRILEEDPDADFRKDSPVVFAFSHMPPDWQDIEERLTNSFRRIYAGRIENDIAARAMYIHNCVIDIWPFDEYNGELAIFAMNYYLMEQGYMPIDMPMDRKDYIELVTSCLKGIRVDEEYEFFRDAIVEKMTGTLEACRGYL